jgi:Fe-S-cluster containining protein
VNTEKGPAFVALKKQQGGDCIFLKDNLCMIHVVRPSVCVAFPFVFERKGRDMAWGLNAMKDICPGLGTGPEVQDSELTRIGTQTVQALSLFRQYVEAWNKTMKAPTALGFLESVLKDARFSRQ